MSEDSTALVPYGDIFEVEGDEIWVADRVGRGVAAVVAAGVELDLDTLDIQPYHGGTIIWSCLGKPQLDKVRCQPQPQ